MPRTVQSAPTRVTVQFRLPGPAQVGSHGDQDAQMVTLELELLFCTAYRATGHIGHEVVLP